MGYLMNKRKMRSVRASLQRLRELKISDILVSSQGNLRVRCPLSNGTLYSVAFCHRYPGARRGLFRDTNISRLDRVRISGVMRERGNDYNPHKIGKMLTQAISDRA